MNEVMVLGSSFKCIFCPNEISVYFKNSQVLSVTYLTYGGCIHKGFVRLIVNYMIVKYSDAESHIGYI